MTDLIHFSDTLLSDASKEAFGSRCRTYKEWWTKEELQAEMDRLCEIMEENEQMENERQSRSVVEWEGRINKYVHQYNIDRNTAIRWDYEATLGEDITEGASLDYYYWMVDLPFEYSAKLPQSLAELEA